MKSVMKKVITRATPGRSLVRNTYVYTTIHHRHLLLPRSCAREGQGWPDTFGQGTSNIKLKLPDTKTLDYHDGG